MSLTRRSLLAGVAAIPMLWGLRWERPKLPPPAICVEALFERWRRWAKEPERRAIPATFEEIVVFERYMRAAWNANPINGPGSWERRQRLYGSFEAPYFHGLPVLYCEEGEPTYRGVPLAPYG